MLQVFVKWYLLFPEPKQWWPGQEDLLWCWHYLSNMLQCIFPSCYIYLPISIQYFQSLNNGDLAKKFDFAAGSFHPISWSCLCHSRSLDHAQVFLPLVQARQNCNITVFCDKNGARMFRNRNKNTTLYLVYNSPKASQGSAGGSTDFFLLQKSNRGHIFHW